LREGAKNFDFKGIAEIDKMEQELKDLKEKYKRAYFAVKDGLVALTNDGELLEIPTIKYNKSSLIVKSK
jgi:hypothetical protein